MPDATPQTTELDLAGRLDRVASYQAIRSLCRDAAHGMDKHDPQRFLDAFHPDGVFDCGPAYGKFVGHEQMAQNLVNHTWSDMTFTLHYSVNNVVSLDGDHGSGVSDQDIVIQSVNSTIWLVSSPQHDTYERRDGVWRIAYRQVWPAHSAQLRARLLTDAGPEPIPAPSTTAPRKEGARPQMTDIAALSKTVDRLESGMDIEQLLYHFAHGVDRRDADEFRQIWHDDATLIVDGQIRRGVEDVMAYLTELNARFPITHHYVVNNGAHIDGDRATGLCDHDIVAQDDSGQAYIVAATVRDAFERRAGQWRISQRTIDVAHTLALDGVTITGSQRSW
jgi:ketosteroid isomerase-like protein